MSGGFSRAKVASNILWRTFNILSNSLLALVVSIMTARILGPDVMGQYSYIVWLTNILLILMGLGVPAAVTKYVAEYVGKGDTETAKSIVKTMFMFELVLAGLITVVSFVLVFWTVEPQDRLIFLLAIGNRLPLALAAIFNAGVQGLQEFKAVSRIEVVNEFVRSLLVIAFLLLGYEVVGIFVAGLIVNVYYLLRIYFLYAEHFAKITARLGFPKELVSRMVRFCATLSGIMIVSSIVWQQSEVFFLNEFSNNEQIAFYSLAFGIGGIFMQFPPIVSQVLMPTISHMSQTVSQFELNRLFNQTTRCLALIFIPMFLGAAAIIEKPLLLMYGEPYREVVVPAMILLSFNIFGAVTVMAAALTSGTDRQGIVFKWTLVVALVNVIADVLLIPEYGAIGAAIANSFAQVVAAVGGTWLILRSFDYSFPIRNLLKIFFASSVMAFVAYSLDRTDAGWLSFIMAIVIGVLVYLLLLRLLSIVTEDDYIFLVELKNKIPSQFLGVYTFVVNFVYAEKSSLLK